MTTKKYEDGYYEYIPSDSCVQIIPLHLAQVIRLCGNYARYRGDVNISLEKLLAGGNIIPLSTPNIAAWHSDWSVQ